MSSLKEKFQEWHDTPTNETVEENILELEKIADDYAIDFAEWMLESYIENNDKISSTKQLLEIFKK